MEAPSNSLTNCFDKSSIQLDSTLSACILMIWLNSYYGSLFNQILSTCVWSLYIPMVELDQYFGLSKVSLQRFWHLLNICKWIHHRSLWLDVTFAPLVPGLQPFTWLGASNVCTSFRRLYTLCYKILCISYNITSNEDNASMWFPLTLQVQYRDFYLLFYHLNRILCGLQGVAVAFSTLLC